MSSTVYNVFIGSTSKDLSEYRAAAREICETLHMFPVMMEDFPAMSAGATRGSLKMLADADVYVGIIGFRYGYIEDPTDGRSITEIEYDEAGKMGPDRLYFLADANARFPFGTYDAENYEKLVQFRAKVSRHIVRFFPDVPTFKVYLMQALISWRDGKLGITRQSTVIVGTLAQDAADLKLYKPSKLIGRDKLLGQIEGWIANGDKILLHGFGGMGKTALAATVAAQFLDAEASRRVVWARIRSQPAAEIFIGLAHAFGPDAARQLTTTLDEHKPRALRELLKTHGVKLIVLDDARDGLALFATLHALPDDLPVLVTSRHHYPMKSQHVDQLGPNDAVAVLAHYAGRDELKNDFDAFALCKTLGHHAFALEIAGKTLKADGISPDVLEQRIHDAPHEMALPLDYADPERDSVAKLLEASLKELDEETKAVFLAFGAFFVPSATPELLARFLNTSPPPAPPHLVERGEKLGDLPPRYAVEKGSRGRDIESVLRTLVRRGLADYISPTDEAVATYRVHDLAQSYARAQHPLEARQRALQACLDYTEAYNEPALVNFAALVPEIDQFVAASQWAMLQEHWEKVEDFAWNLYVKSKVLDYRGYAQQSIAILTLAITAAEKQGDHFNRGAYLDSIATIYQEIGKMQQAISYFERALQLAHEIGNKAVEGRTFGNLGSAYSDLGELQRAISYYQQALTIAKEIGDKHGEGAVFGNLGNVYSDLGELQQAISYYQQAFTIAKEIGDKRSEGAVLGSLGNVYSKLGEPQQAIGYYQQAQAILAAIGDRKGESNDLYNLGAAHAELGQYERALDYYQQARAIFKVIGAKHLIEKSDRNIARVEAKLRGE